MRILQVVFLLLFNYLDSLPKLYEVTRVAYMLHNKYFFKFLHGYGIKLSTLLNLNTTFKYFLMTLQICDKYLTNVT